MTSCRQQYIDDCSEMVLQCIKRYDDFGNNTQDATAKTLRKIYKELDGNSNPSKMTNEFATLMTIATEMGDDLENGLYAHPEYAKYMTFHIHRVITCLKNLNAWEDKS